MYAVLEAWCGTAEQFGTSSQTHYGQVGLKNSDGKKKKGLILNKRDRISHIHK